MQDDFALYKIKALDHLIFRELIDERALREGKILTPTQMRVIGYLLKNDDVYQRDLEAILNLRRATVSGVLQTMEKNNLIERVVSLDDTRVKKIILCDKARDIFVKEEEKVIKLEKKLTEGISKADLKKFVEVIDKMKSNLQTQKK